MANTVVDIPGVGQVEFPDSMSTDAINAAAKRLYEQAQAQSKQTSNTATSASSAPAGILKTLKDDAVQGGIGFAKGVGRTLNDIAPLLPGGESLSVARAAYPNNPIDQTINGALAPTNTAQKVGGYAEDAAELFGPAALAGVKGAAELNAGRKLALAAREAPTASKIILTDAPDVLSGPPVATNILQKTGQAGTNAALDYGPSLLKTAVKGAGGTLVGLELLKMFGPGILKSVLLDSGK